MKLSFKTTTLIAAIGMIVYTAYVLTRYAIYEFCSMPPYHYHLGYDISVRLIYDILPLSMIVACCGLWKYRPAENASKSFRVFTICLFVVMFCTLLFSPLYTVYIAGLEHIYPSIYWRALILVAGIVWLFMLRKQPLEEASPRSYRVTLILAILLLTLPIILEALSGISCMLNGHVLNFDSSTIKAWLRWIVPTLVMIHFVFPSIKRINYTRNSHCTPGSFEERTFQRNRIITLVFVSITVITAVAFVGCLACYRFLHGYYHHASGLIDDIAVICVCTTIITGLLSWIMLSFMAFRQLPNPRGYKIYNIICQIVTWGSLLVDFWASDGVNEVFGMIFVISFCAFFITTAIRVISYSLPKPLEQ